MITVILLQIFLFLVLTLLFKLTWQVKDYNTSERRPLKFCLLYYIIGIAFSVVPVLGCFMITAILISLLFASFSNDVDEVLEGFSGEDEGRIILREKPYLLKKLKDLKI